ncbi:MAG: hypothetical protein LBE31_06490, partial [Deltaproteobacteria bacterium]|nr:hypothetical protein [Deltaproteobacteria bacterium]
MIPVNTTSLASNNTSKSIKIAILLLVVGLALGCGVKTHPYPEMVTLPSRVTDLNQYLDDTGRLILTWSPPQRNMADRPLRTLDHFEIWGADYDALDYCEGCPVKLSKIDEVYLDVPAPGLTIAPGPYQWQTKLRPGRVYVFEVAGYSSRGAVHPGAKVQTTVWNEPAYDKLQNFTIEPDDLAVRLSYLAPSGAEIEVQRRDNDGPFVTLNLARDGSVDTSVSYGHHYVYRARTIKVKGQTRIPSSWTSELSVYIEDLTPPPPPSYLDAVLTPQGIKLVWEDLYERGDVKSYRLYRRLEGEGKFELIAELTSENTYLDKPPSL